jgi:hypothetical protein
VNEVVRNAVDVPGNADRVDKTENDHDPKGDSREKIGHSKKVRAVQNSGGNRDDVPARVGKDPGIRPGKFDDCKLT